jgi:phosphatidylglycerophosphatase A
MFGAGLLPGAPGTWGSAAAILLLLPLLSAAAALPNGQTIVLLAGLLLFSVLTVALGRYAVADFGSLDPPSFVLDEAAGICLTLLFLPQRQGWGLVELLLLAFAAFRLFDVTKPPPAKALEKLPAGWGILMDDLAAAVYANLLCRVLLFLSG